MTAFRIEQKRLVAVLSSSLILLIYFSCTNGGNSFRQFTSWGIAEVIGSSDLDSVIMPQIAMDSTGTAIAVWHQLDGTRRNIWANRFDGTAWGTAELIETDNVGNAFYPQIAMDSYGSAIAAWNQLDGTRTNIWANRFDGTIWGTAELIETDNTGDALYPQIAMDSFGSAIAVWKQDDGTRTNIWANRFDGTAWSTAQMIEADTTKHSLSPKITMNDTGAAIAVWEQYEISTINASWDVWANRFDGTAWGTAELISAGTSEDFLDFLYPQIAMDSSGSAIAIWHQLDGTRTNIWTNRFDGTAWGTAQTVESYFIGNPGRPRIAMDGTGKAIAVWHQYDGRTRINIWANRFDGAVWGRAELIETDNTGDALVPEVAMDDTGNAIAVWHQYNGNTRINIWANRLESSSP